LGYAIGKLADIGEEAARQKRKLHTLREGIEFTLNCGDWIAWLDTNAWAARVLNIAPMSAHRAAAKLFRGFDHVLFASATIGNVNVFLRGLGIEASQAGVHLASCDIPPENRPVYYIPKGSLAKATGQAGFLLIMQGIREVLQRHPDERGILHCHSNALRDRILSNLVSDFGTRVITHGLKHDRDVGVERLRISRNGVLVSIAMTEGVSLDDGDGRFCIFPKVPWPDMGDPYTKARMQRDDEWYANQAALAIVQGSGRIVRHAEDYGETYILDSSFGRVLRDATFPEWWIAALTGKKPAKERR
jgi:Rad3-related DNA helicase